MSTECLKQLESKLQNLVDRVELLKMELEETKESNMRLETENDNLKRELLSWEEKVSSLVGKIDHMTQTDEHENSIISSNKHGHEILV